MTLIPVDSSAIRAVGYEGDTLGVLFHTSDTVYLHWGVPYEVFLALIIAPSKGRFYNACILGRYS